MDEQIQTASDTIKSGPLQTASKAHQNALRLAALRAVWIALAILVLAIFFSAMAVALHETQTACTGGDCTGIELGPEDAGALGRLGIPVGFIAWTETFWSAAIFLTLLAAATLVFWRQPNNRMAVLTSFWLLAFFVTFEDGLMLTLTRGDPRWYWAVTLVEAIGAWFSLIVWYLFPSGEFVPVRSRLMLLPVTAYSLLLLLIPLPAVTNMNSATPLDALLKAMGAGFLITGLVAQIHRYRRLSSPVERRQTQWVLFGSALFVLEVIAYSALPIIYPPVIAPGLARLLYHNLGTALTHLFLLFFILCMAIAILRYRLWNIDLLINRTLVYVPLTAILAGLFAASVALLQRAFIAATRQGSDLSAVVGTLLVVAALTPVKDRLQTAVDKRFKYVNDPARKLDAFEEQLRTRYYAIDPIQATRRMTEETMAAFGAKGGAVFWGDEKQPSHTCGEWDGEIRLSAAVAGRDKKYGTAALSARRNGRRYDDADRATFQRAASFVAEIIEQDSRAAVPDHPA